jgi:glycosyltransferase involved in cell wall biosynthesis
MALRVLHFVGDLAPYGEGSPLVELLPQLTDPRYEHQVLTIGPSNNQGHSPGTNVATASLHARWSVDPVAWGRLQHRLRHDPPDLVHAWDTRALRWLLASAPRRARFRSLATLSRTRPLEPRLARRALGVLDRWIATSHTAHTAAVQSGLPEGRGVLIHRGAPAPPKPAPREQLLAEWGLPANSPLIATTGPLEHEAQLKELIWAADMVRVLHPAVRLVIVGEGPARQGLEYFARTAAIPENIVFAGNRSPYELYPHCRVYWTGSETGDTSGNLLSAMACGVPVVASDVPLHRQWIDHGKQGYLVGLAARADRTRATDQLLSDNELHGRMGAAARERAVAEHSLKREASEVEQVYREWDA